MPGRRKGTKNSSDKAPTRELFSDDVTQAETQTTRAPEPEKRHAGTPPYLERRPVKFINVPVWGRFLLNNTTWVKVTPDHGEYVIRSGCNISPQREKIDPATLVFPLEDSRP